MWKNIDFDKIIITVLFIIIVAMGIYTHVITNRTETVINEIEKYDEDENRYTKIYYDQELSVLKKKNKELYDSLKSQEDQIEFLTQFKYTKKYSTGTIFIEKENEQDADSIKENEQNVDSIKVKEFTYQNEPNDTLKYELKIGSTTPPNWYKLDFEISDQFTIVNKQVGNGLSETNIESNSTAIIEDVIVFSKKEKTKFWNKVAVGPSVSVGYDPINNNCNFMIGVSVTYNLFGK